MRSNPLEFSRLFPEIDCPRSHGRIRGQENAKRMTKARRSSREVGGYSDPRDKKFHFTAKLHHRFIATVKDQAQIIEMDSPLPGRDAWSWPQENVNSVREISPGPRFGKAHFLGLDFSVLDNHRWCDLILSQSTREFSILVTPNVDHVVQIHRNETLAEAYRQADWHLCDSRILNRLALHRGIELKTYPGADLVRDVLQDPRSATRRIAVLGPDRENFDRLCARFPGRELIWIEAPMMAIDSPEWDRTLAATEAVEFDVLFVCTSFPKQEVFACQLKERGMARGIAVCAGASLDFLTGRQRRAPRFMQRLGLEWLYRLGTNPRRLFRRYVIDGPRIFYLYLRDR